MSADPVDYGFIQLVVVVIPVRDEAERIAACLDALGGAIHALSLTSRYVARPRVRAMVVLDRCTDGTAGIVARYPWVESVTSTAGQVGAARAYGVATALEGESVARDRIWVATTDADSRVPAEWLTHQLDLAAQGTDLFRGLVEPDPEECGGAAYDAWSSAYTRVDGHHHVHGANLGVRANAYTLCGGFSHLAADEDLTLTLAAQSQDLRIAASSQARVATSGRLQGRVEGRGFAEYLRLLTHPRPGILSDETGRSTSGSI